MAKFYAEVEFEVSGTREPGDPSVGMEATMTDIEVESMSLVAYDVTNKCHVSIPLKFDIPEALACALLEKCEDEIMEALFYDYEEDDRERCDV